MDTHQTTQEALLAVASTLRIDAHAATLLSTLADAEVPCIVLKGPAFANLLYPAEVRLYDDIDLLVPATRVDEAETVLERLGYVGRAAPRAFPGANKPHARHWDRSADEHHIDLHHTLNGATVTPQEVWDLLEPHSVELTVGGRPARGLDRAASGVLCALHIAAHGPAGKPLEDLTRALSLLEPSDWEDAYGLAAALGAEEPFASGLGFVAAGRRVADALGLPDEPSVVRLLQADLSAPSGARALHRLGTVDSFRDFVVMVGMVLFPPAHEMRRYRPLARRGTVGLIASYPVRHLRLLVSAPRALFTLSRARRAAARRSPPR